MYACPSDITEIALYNVNCTKCKTCIIALNGRHTVTLNRGPAAQNKSIKLH